MPNGQETDVSGDPNEPQVDVWVTDPDEVVVDDGRTKADQRAPFTATPVPAIDLQRPRGAALPDAEPAIDTRDLPLLPQLPATPPTDPMLPPSQEEIARWQLVINDYEREAKAIGNEPGAASLYVEIGRVWEEQLN